MSDQTDEIARFESGGDLKEKLDDYNKKYLLSDAEQDVIKKAIEFVKEFNHSDLRDTLNSMYVLRNTVEAYEEIKNKLR